MSARMANTDTVLPTGGGEDGESPLLVQKGQLVGWSKYAMQRRKDIYGEDADEFRPERWETLQPGWSYLPFSGWVVPHVHCAMRPLLTKDLEDRESVLEVSSSRKS